MRDPPLYSTTSNSARSTSAPVAGLVAGPRGAKICTHVPGSPFELERQIPLAPKVAYTVLGSTGSKCTRRAPRGEQGVRPLKTSVGVAVVQFVVLP